MEEPMPVFWHRAKIEHLIENPPSTPVTVLSGDARILAKVRATYGRVVAYTPTHGLYEWADGGGELRALWEEAKQIRRVTAQEWKGRPLPD
ncbi:hypothetical protein ACQCSX_04560 [Pseudarthrobacter sp. P1]|uniref:hypothetical protein n=1 Tax=Pseudarthrobacter sp. P1 TaxID=3418418 RepID=UPI003CEAE5DB